MEELQETHQTEKPHTHTRRVAELFADECIRALIHRTRDNTDSKILVSVEHDSLDLTVRDDRDTLTTRAGEEFTLPLEQLQDLQVEITIRGSDQCYELELEAFTYTSDDEEIIRDAIINVDVTIPNKWSAWDVLRSEITAALVHEFRHTVQHCVWNWRSETSINEQDAEQHLFNAAEVDARVEEICSYSSLKMSEMTADTFAELSRKYIRDYIDRNDLNDRHGLMSQAVSHHLGFWNMRARSEEFDRPT